MSQASLGGSGGYPSDWEPIYDTCDHAAACTVCCHSESAFFCHSCDARSHVGDPTARQHQPVWVCTACENAPAAFTCQADAASLCISCDIEIHSAKQLARRHNSVPIPPLSGIGFAASTNHLEKPHTENEIFSGDKCDDKLEEEIDSWLLLDLDANNSHSNGLFTYGEKADEYLDPIKHNLYAEYQRQDQNDLNQLSSSHQEEEGSDIVAPQQSFDENEQQQQQQIYFNREHEASKAAFINNTSSSQWFLLMLWFCTPAPTPFMNAGYLLKATARDISSSYSRFSKETTNLFQKYPSLLMPIGFIATNREARVTRYREKRKVRKFEKNIRYAAKKATAENKPRVKGRFVRKTDMEFEVDVDQMFSTEDYGNGIVPSSPSTTRE